MSMDGLSLHAAVYELNQLVGGKIDKVQQPDADALLLTVRGQNGTKKLLINSHAQNGRMHLTEAAFENPDSPPAFCMLLRKRLIGGRIEGVYQTGLDRIATIDILARDEMFDEVKLKLVVELMGKYSNITLVLADGRVADAIHRVPLGVSSVRAVLPGLPYEAPPAQDKRDPFALTDAEIYDAISGADDISARLLAEFQGFAKATARLIAADCPDARAVAARISSLRTGPFPVYLLRNSLGEPVAVCPFPVSDGEKQATLSAAYDVYYAERDRIVRMQRHGSSLRRSIENLLHRSENKLAAYREAIDGAADAEEYRLFGELITANLHKIHRGDAEVYCDNYYTAPPTTVCVPLDAAKSAPENAARCFKQYKKSRAAREYALSRKDDLIGEIAYLEGQLDNIEKCQTSAELNEIREELVAGGFLRADQGKKRAAKSALSKPMRYVSSDGVPLYVGKNNRQNEQLTLRQAASENYFVHVKNIPGSHVLIECEGEPPERTLNEACQLAAFYSKAKGSASVPVDYTPRKYVKKPSGARPGMVIYSTNRTAYITPDALAVQRLTRLD